MAYKIWSYNITLKILSVSLTCGIMEYKSKFLIYFVILVITIDIYDMHTVDQIQKKCHWLTVLQTFYWLKSNSEAYAQI